jgi:hypothetical protein
MSHFWQSSAFAIKSPGFEVIALFIRNMNIVQLFNQLCFVPKDVIQARSAARE